MTMKKTVLLGLLLLFNVVVQAAPVQYDVAYSRSSEYTGLPLHHALLDLRVYVNGEPRGFLTRVTDCHNSFTVDNVWGEMFVVEVVRIKGQPENVRCHGVAARDDQVVDITCRYL